MDTYWDEAFGHRPDRRLEGKVAHITGAGSSGPGYGTGKAIAGQMAREGARVALLDRNPIAARQTHTLIAEDGGISTTVTGDIVNDDEARAAGETAVTGFGALDILVNNVGIVVRGDATTTVPEDWQRVLEINLIGMVNMARHAVPVMAGAGGGATANISSISPRRPYSATPYSVSKGAVDTLTALLAVDHGQQGIRVNRIAPGPLRTPRAERLQTGERRDLRRAASPFGIEGSGFDVACAAVYLASDEARYVTGTELTVDGGASIQGHRYRLEDTMPERVILITGAGGGIGSAICRELAGPGTAILACDRHCGADVEQALSAIRAKGGRGAAAAGDLADPDVLSELVDAVLCEFGLLSGVASNAGVPAAGSLDKVTLEEWDHAMAIDLRASWLLARAAFPHLRAARGIMVATSSVSGIGPQHGMGPYNVAKCGLIMLCQTLAQEWGQFGIRVNAVSPGFVRSPLPEATYADSERHPARTALVPRNRIGTPDDIGRGVAWLASDAAEYVTGHNTVIDGGFPGTANRQITPAPRNSA